MPVRPGSMGRAVPGHEVAVIDDAGVVLPPGEVGEIAVSRPDPVMFLGYWNRPDATAAKFSGDWMRTGDRASIDADGYIWYQARNDDVITSSGYRIGPGEIEDCLLRHPAVGMVAVVGIPDPDPDRDHQGLRRPRAGRGRVRGADRRAPGLRPRTPGRPRVPTRDRIRRASCR